MKAANLVFLPIVSAFVTPCRRPQALPNRLFNSKLDGVVSKVLETSRSPFAGRSIQISDQEDSTDRVTNVKLEPDGSLVFVADSTKPIDVQGGWRIGEGGKIGLILERFYTETGDTTYSFVRIYEGTYIHSGDSLRGEGRIEMEKYNDLIQVGFFSFITTDDSPDEFTQLRHRDALDGLRPGLDF